MSLTESIVSALRSLGFSQLAVALVALLGYSLALNGAVSQRTKIKAAAAAFCAAAGFALLTPSWMTGVVLMALGIAALAAFAAAVWLIARVFDLDPSRASGTATGFEDSRLPPLPGRRSAPVRGAVRST